jgi:hemoglobin/transferrin/lactoferrin receptor protein
MAKLGYTFDNGGHIKFSASETTDSGYRASQNGFIRPDFAAISGLTSDLYEALSQRTAYTLTYENENAAGAFAPYLQLSYNEQAMDVNSLYGVNKSFSGVAKNEFQLSSGTVTAGVDFFKESAEGFDNTVSPRTSTGRENLSNIGIFAQARQDVSERVSASYGARYDWASLEGTDGEIHDANGASVNGSLDIVLNDQWTLNAGAASNWGGFELGEAVLVDYWGPWTYDDITPSKATSLRLGLRFESGAWSAKSAIFDTDIKDISASSGDRGDTTDLTSRGFDGSLTYTGVNGFATLNYTYADVRTDDETASTTDYYLGRPVGHIFGLAAGYDIASEWRLGGTAQIALENNDTEVALPSYEVVNLYAQYQPTQMENLNIRLDIYNLFDAEYASRSSDGLDNSHVIVLNEPGRTVSLTASIKF